MSVCNAHNEAAICQFFFPGVRWCGLFRISLEIIIAHRIKVHSELATSVTSAPTLCATPVGSSVYNNRKNEPRLMELGLRGPKNHSPYPLTRHLVLS